MRTSGGPRRALVVGGIFSSCGGRETEQARRWVGKADSRSSCPGTKGTLGPILILANRECFALPRDPELSREGGRIEAEGCGMGAVVVGRGLRNEYLTNRAANCRTKDMIRKSLSRREGFCLIVFGRSVLGTASRRIE